MGLFPQIFWWIFFKTCPKFFRHLPFLSIPKFFWRPFFYSSPNFFWLYRHKKILLDFLDLKISLNPLKTLRKHLFTLQIDEKNNIFLDFIAKNCSSNYKSLDSSSCDYCWYSVITNPWTEVRVIIVGIV